MARKITDGIVTILGGMSQAVDPALLANNQYAMGVNITSRGGLPSTRPVFRKILVTFAHGLFQGAARYTLNAFERIVFGIAGHVYSLNVETGDIIDFGLKLNPDARKFYFAQVDRYMVIQDGEAGDSWDDAKWPVVLYEDEEYVYPDDVAEYNRFPKGSVMAYGHGRAFVVVQYVYNRGTSSWSNKLGEVGFVAGDIIQPLDPESVLLFRETDYFQGGGRFTLPAELGTINAMGFQRNVMSGTGQGPLIVGADNGFSSYQVQLPRPEWQTTDLSQVLFTGTGTCSDRTFRTINSDIWYRSEDGQRSLRDTVAKTQGGGLANDPLSAEIKDILALDDLTTLDRVSSAFANNRYLTTVNPVDDYFMGLASLDFLPITSLTAPASPIYDGVWTGLRFLQVLNLIYQDKMRAFAFHKDTRDDIHLFYLDDDDFEDYNEQNPKCRIYTGYRSFSQQDNGVSVFDVKRILYIELWLHDVKGDVNFTAYYRPDRHAFWNAMTSGRVRSLSGGDPRRFRRIRLTPLDVGYDDLTEESLNVGESFQFCIQWTGHMTIDRVRFRMQQEESVEPIIAENIDYDFVDLLPGDNLIELDDYDYEVEV